MRKVLIGIAFIYPLAAPPSWAQTSAVAAPSTLSDQQFACQQKVNQLTEQLRPIQSKLSTLRSERKGISASGGEVARFKLANLDQEISQLIKQQEGVNGQITTEKKRCDDLAKPKSASDPPPQSQPQAQSPPPRKKRDRDR